MTRLDDLNASELQHLTRRVDRLESAAPLVASSVTRGRVRIGGSAQLLVDSSGGIQVNGSFAGSGTFSWTGPTTLAGSMTLSGPMSITGTQTVTGTLNVNGPWNLNGAGTISGATTLSSTLTVTGQITSGSTVLNSTGLSNPSILFLQAPTVSCNQKLSVTGDFAANGNITAVNLPTTTATANVFLTTGGVFQKITSARRFKIDPQPMNLADSLLRVPVKDWIDRGQHDRGEDIGRIPGVIAEEVEAAGGQSFVTYNADGRIEGVAYDRFALARTEILARENGYLRADLAELRTQFEELRDSLRSA